MEQPSISITGSVGTETIPISLVIGHEFVGFVEKVGSSVHVSVQVAKEILTVTAVETVLLGADTCA